MELLFPQSCLLCSSWQAGSLGICGNCLHDMPWHLSNTCPQCALPSPGGHLCGHCIQAPPAFDTTRSLFQYQFPLSALLQQYKYRQLLTLAHSLGNLLAEHVRQQSFADCIIPMPLHKQRLQQRGFNQSVEIAKVVSKQLHIPLNLQACARIKPTPPQASLPYKQRIKNMHGAFDCNTSLQGMKVVLLDDVMTTGASLNALAKTVKAAGASHVECWVIARTLSQ
ncbi:ComF family protein [Methylobacillus arboreus]|uniref:ComF family protein n=1 Tax=Methylobacillus arboreus TaxID=755170 RepID=UPI001E28DBA0|nr:ComF family protein [Methylobacillus arboreus]